ncbi:MAG: DNA-directed RNA polymerase subunit alpha [Candidatus Liptonbacteria bacterium]|nr:DNA-directed RNA polymerase subunit alpha [Candidatus Liptonbacteria bacterium]
MEYSYLSESVNIKKFSEDKKVGVFNIEGFYPGYGLTIGNSLRRALLSSIPGAAITQFKIKGILHEFSTISGVLEDVIEIGLNLKKVRFSFYADSPQVLTLKVKGEKKVFAKDITSNAQVIVANVDQHLFTVTDKKAEIELELTVEKGLGYVSVEKRKTEKLEIGIITLDAFFSPVRNVSFMIEDMRVGKRTDYNRLKLTIETDGSILPSEALYKASNILCDHFKKIFLIKESSLVKGQSKDEEESVVFEEDKKEIRGEDKKSVKVSKK